MLSEELIMDTTTTPTPPGSIGTQNCGAIVSYLHQQTNVADILRAMLTFRKRVADAKSV